MHFQELKPKDIQQFIDEYRSGRSIRYIWCKEDTQEAIDGLYSLSYVDYADIDALFNWFLDSFAMRTNSDGNSFYRAFLTLYNDEILNFRLSRHYSTENSTSGAFMQNGQPDIEYHLIIERVSSTSSSPTITSTTDFMGTTEVIFDVSFNDFKNNGEWERFANELILYLTYGKRKGTNENKIRYNMNKKPIQLTESDLHNIVENVVSNMLNGMGINGQQQQNQQTQQTQSQQQTQQQPQQQQRQQLPQQQQGQQQNNNNQPLTAAQFIQWNRQFNQFMIKMGQQIMTMDKKLDAIFNGRVGGFKGLNNM